MTDTVPIGLIVVRLKVPVKNYPVGTELGYKDVADAIAALGSAYFFEVVRDQQGNPIPPLTPEEIEEAQRAAQRRAKSRRLILGADFDPLWDRVEGIPSAEELTDMQAAVEAVADVPPRVEAVETAVQPVQDLTTSMSLRGRPTGPYVAPSGAVYPEDHGAKGDLSIICDTAFALAIADAKSTSISQGRGIPVISNGARYALTSPIVLPRSGLTPSGIVKLQGRGPHETQLYALDSFPTGRGVIEWDATPTRAYYQEISNLSIRLPNKAGVRAIWHKKVGSGTTMTDYWNEWLELSILNVSISASNTFHDVLMMFEVGVKQGVFDTIYGLVSRGTNPIHDTLMFDVEDRIGGADLSTISDSVGLGYMRIANVLPMYISGGWCRTFDGRIHSSEWRGGFLQGGRKAEPNLNLRNAHQSTFTNVRFEAYAESAQVALTNCLHLTFNDCGLGLPGAQHDAWKANTAYAVGAVVVDPGITTASGNRYTFTCTTAGTSGATVPAWPTAEGATVTDGTVVWTRGEAAVGHGAVLTNTHHTRWRGRSVSPGSQAFSDQARSKAIVIDAASSDNVFEEFGINLGTSGNPDDEFDFQGTPDKHNLAYGPTISGPSATPVRGRYVVGWHPAYPEIVRPPVQVTGNHTANIAEREIHADTAGTPLTVTLPQASHLVGKTYTIRKTDGFSTAVTVSTIGGGSAGFGGSGTSRALTKRDEAITLIAKSDNRWWVTNWGVMGSPAAANPDTSGATVAELETEVNEIKALLRNRRVMES